MEIIVDHLNSTDKSHVAHPHAQDCVALQFFHPIFFRLFVVTEFTVVLLTRLRLTDYCREKWGNLEHLTLNSAEIGQSSR